MTSVFISPKVRSNAIGGISRVVEAQVRWLPKYDIEVVPEPHLADVLAFHAAAWNEPSPVQKTVAHCHGLYWQDYTWDKWASMVNTEVIDNLRRSDAITVPSEWVANAIRRDTWANVQVIGHGIDLDAWHPQDNNGYVLWNKTREDAVCDPRVVNILAAAMPHTRFVTTFGDDANNVRVVGTLPYSEHKEYIEHAGLYLCTTRETFGIGTLEAMACGVPIVGWNYGGQADFVKSGEHGWLSTVGDYDDLARGIEYCLDNRQRLSLACRQLVESNYQWQDIIGKYADLYESLSIKNDIRVSIIISSYNLHRYLGRCVSSCVSQDYPHEKYEIIVVDDCSTDGSYELAKQFEESTPNVRVLRTPVNSNMPTVLNTGISAARGAYVVPLDADNLLAPGALKILADALDHDHNYDIVYGRVKFVLDDGATPDTRVAADGISRWPPKEFSYSEQMTHHNQIPSTAMYRRKWFDISGGYRKRCTKLGEDPDFWCRITSLGAKAARVTDAVTLIYRMREDSRSNTNNEWPWEEWYPNRGFMIGGPIRINEPMVSIIIPVGPGHGVQGIEDALDSVYAQTYTNWECIVVDDTGDSIRWLPSWVKRGSTNKYAAGVSHARNIGINMATAGCFVLLDADDYLDKHALEKLMAAWQQNPNSYIYCGWYKIEDGLTPYSVESIYSPEVLLHNLIHPVTALYPIEVRDKVQFDESRTYGEDWDYILGCMANGFCGVQLDEPLVYYRQSSGHNRKALKDNIELVRKQLNDKWGSRVMACGCQQKHVTPKEALQQMVAQNQNNGELVLLEYIGSSQGSINYTGPATGQSYKFGLTSGHNIKYVHRADADHLLQRTEFKLADAVLV